MSELGLLKGKLKEPRKIEFGRVKEAMVSLTK